MEVPAQGLVRQCGFEDAVSTGIILGTRNTKTTNFFLFSDVAVEENAWSFGVHGRYTGHLQKPVSLRL